MTESEAWDSLAAHLQEKNYTGVLVLADWFQENGQEAVATYLRWAEKKKFLPIFKPVRYNDMSELTPSWYARYKVDRESHWYYFKEELLRDEIVSMAAILRLMQEWYCD